MAAVADLTNLVARLEVVAQKLEGASAGGGASDQATAQFVEDYDGFVEQFIVPVLKTSGEIGGVVDDQAKLLKTIVDEQRKFLVIASTHSAPTQGDLAKMLAPMSANIGKMEDFKNKLDRKSNLVNHVRAHCEGIGAFGWIAVTPAPMKFVTDVKETVMFYTNKVLTEFKNSDDKEKHRAFVKAYVAFFDGLRDYIKEHHRTGVSWNAKLPPATLSSGPPPPPAAPAPPPPPPAGTVVASPAPSKAPSASAVNALMQDISKGADVTKGLKKVTNDMKTHKNPELRKHHVPVPYKAATTSYKPMGKTQSQAPAKPPKLELQGKKWVVENQQKATLAIDDCEMKHTVYIYKCNECTISIGKKVNSIVLDTCKKTGLVFASVVSGVEVINCQSVQVQAQGQMHSVSIDKTDGCIIFLSKDCINANIVTAKSSEMNVSVPTDGGDFEEYPIVEQFRTTWNADKKTFITVPSEQLG